MRSLSDYEILSLTMFGTVKKVSKFVVDYKNDVIFIGSATTCGFILQRVCKEYVSNQKELYSVQKLKDSKSKSRKIRHRIINFLARKGGRALFFIALAGKSGPKIIVSKAFREAIYKSLPYTFSDDEKTRWVVEVAKDKRIYKKIRFFMKLLSYVSGITSFGLLSLLFLDAILWSLDDILWAIGHLNAEFYEFYFLLTGVLPPVEIEVSPERAVGLLVLHFLKYNIF